MHNNSNNNINNVPFLYLPDLELTFNFNAFYHSLFYCIFIFKCIFITTVNKDIIIIWYNFWVLCKTFQWVSSVLPIIKLMKNDQAFVLLADYVCCRFTYLILLSVYTKKWVQLCTHYSIIAGLLLHDWMEHIQVCHNGMIHLDGKIPDHRELWTKKW